PLVPPPAPARGHRPARRGGAGRTFALLLFLLVLAGAGAAAVVATSNSGNAVQLRQVVYNDVNQTVDAMKQLVNDNTK
ncbi:MAG: serine/threonine protein kinase, partial [Solirubrobacterales bacterium]|nr:serine/threonine protein kinase [Solirubrobacterales bacterium]